MILPWLGRSIGTIGSALGRGLGRAGRTALGAAKGYTAYRVGSWLLSHPAASAAGMGAYRGLKGQSLFGGAIRPLCFCTGMARPPSTKFSWKPILVALTVLLLLGVNELF
jgi:hypothetical protein